MKKELEFHRLLSLLSIVLFLGITLIACKSEQEAGAEPKDAVLQEIAGDYYQELIRTPVNSDGVTDTVNVPKIAFEKYTHHFGTLTQKDKQKHQFVFTNVGKKNLILLNVTTSCGCTVANYDQSPIAPGAKGTIDIDYDPKNRKGLQEKKIIVTSNAFPNKTELTIIANVIKGGELVN